MTSSAVLAKIENMLRTGGWHELADELVAVTGLVVPQDVLDALRSQAAAQRGLGHTGTASSLEELVAKVQKAQTVRSALATAWRLAKAGVW